MASPFLKAAQAALKAAGSVGATKTATLRRTRDGTYNPGAGTTSGETTKDYTWSVVLSDYADALVDGSTIVSGDRRALGAAADLDVEPDPETDTLLIDSTTYTVVRVKRDPADATYELQVRR